MAMYYYNGVLLPKLPADVLAEYPYCWVRKNTTNSEYQFIFSKVGFYYESTSSAFADKNGDNNPKYICSFTDTSQLVEASDSSDFNRFGVDTQRPCMWSNHDIPNGSADSTEIYFYGSEYVDPNAPAEVYYKISGARLKGFADQARRLGEVTGELTPEQIEDTLSGVEKPKELPIAEENTFGGDEENAEYIIQGETLTAIADQVQRITGVTDELSPEQMETNLLNVTVGAELPTAEESIFGVISGDTEYGILVEGNSASAGTLSSFVTFGWKFTVAEAFSIIGFRVKDNKSAYRKINLWDSSGNIVASVEKNDMASDWVSYYLDSPINVAIDETYTITTYSYVPDFIRFDSTSFNPKLKNIEVRQANTDVFPTSSNYYSKITLVDIIIAPIQAELPDSYEVQRSTMDDIAEEVQRIIGATTKLSTTQIITALQGVEAQS